LAGKAAVASIILQKVQVRGRARLLETLRDLPHETDAVSSRDRIVDDEKALPSACVVTSTLKARTVHRFTRFPGAPSAEHCAMLRFALVCRLTRSDTVAN
jgi:hypothetical protein